MHYTATCTRALHGNPRRGHAAMRVYTDALAHTHRDVCGHKTCVAGKLRVQAEKSKRITGIAQATARREGRRHLQGRRRRVLAAVLLSCCGHAAPHSARLFAALARTQDVQDVHHAPTRKTHTAEHSDACKEHDRAHAGQQASKTVLATPHTQTASCQRTTAMSNDARSGELLAPRTCPREGRRSHVEGSAKLEEGFDGRSLAVVGRQVQAAPPEQLPPPTTKRPDDTARGT